MGSHPVMAWWRRRPATAFRRQDLAYVSPLHGAMVDEPAPAATWALLLLIAVLCAGLAWAALARVDIVAKATGRVVGDGREQQVASLEGGILRELRVREGDGVDAGQVLAVLDPTRFEAQQAEGQARRDALRVAIARLRAEAAGQPLDTGRELRGPAAVVQAEAASYQARQRALQEAVQTQRRSMQLVKAELAVAESMSVRGLMSEVEVMRLRRQLNDLDLQVQERINRFRQDASAELVRLRTELAMLDEQMVARDDALRRTVLTAPVRGVVKTVRSHTVGGVVAPGAPVVELLPLGQRIRVEARIRPADIGFVQVGQSALVKLTAFDFTVYGGLQGRVASISPDAVSDGERQADGGYYRAIIEADAGALRAGGQALSVLPGMTGSVEVRTGERSVLGFLLRPLLKSQEAFRER
jgi:membrane fusion protein, adhesin transport system